MARAETEGLAVLNSNARPAPIVKKLQEKIDAQVALNAERAAEENRRLRPDYRRIRNGIAPEAVEREPEEQLKAPLVIAAAKTQKSSFPSCEWERTAAVFAALMQSKSPTDAETLAHSFRQASSERLARPHSQ